MRAGHVAVGPQEQVERQQFAGGVGCRLVTTTILGAGPLFDVVSGVVAMLLPAAVVTGAHHADAIALGVVLVIWIVGAFGGYLFVARPAWAVPG